MNLNDLVWTNHQRTSRLSGKSILYWDAKEIELEEAVLQKIDHEDFLGKDSEYMVLKLALIPFYQPLFEKAFGTEEITSDRIGTALSQFIYSMASFDSKYDRVLTEVPGVEFTTLEEEGRQVFITNCSSRCHAESNFSSIVPMNNGLDSVYLFIDRGVADWTGRDSDIGKFKSPSLRNIEMTAPYMHDGRFNTLEEVVDFYSEGVNAHRNAGFGEVGQPSDFTGFNFTDHEKEAIIAFLKTLTSPGLFTQEKWSDPFENCVSVEEEQLSAAINVFPNPIAESFTIDLGGLTTKPTDLKMFDHAGKLVWENQTDGSVKQSFEVADLPTGVYVLQLAIDGVFASKKLLIR